MKAAEQDAIGISVARPEERTAALGLALNSLPAAERAALIAQAVARTGQGQSLDGLFVARRGEQLIGALCCEIQPGKTAGLWPPQIAAGEAEADDCARKLLAASLAWLASQQVRMVQSMLVADAGHDADRLQAAGFSHPADLLYLVSLQPSFPAAPPGARLAFESAAARGEEGLAKLVEATYEQTLDCPSLNGVQDCCDVLAGYRATSSFDPSLWFVARCEDRDVGCLLMADFAELNQWLLVYMGLLPEARGRGLGIELVRHAQWLCSQAGRGRMILAVDADNKPAIDIYAAAGFIAWDRRSVWLRVLED
jgi:mycothiol synthase